MFPACSTKEAATTGLEGLSVTVPLFLKQTSAEEAVHCFVVLKQAMLEQELL